MVKRTLTYSMSAETERQDIAFFTLSEERAYWATQIFHRLHMLMND